MKKILVLFSVLFVVSGCAAILEPLLDLGYLRTYSGEPLPREDVAIVTHKNPYSQEILFVGVDGRKIEAIATGFIELLPGEHVISVRWQNVYGNTVYTSESTVLVHSQLKPGHTYIVESNFNKQTRQKWNPAVVDISSEIDSPDYKATKKAIDDYFQRERTAYSESISR